jgi:hypothetical protein
MFYFTKGLFEEALPANIGLAQHRQEVDNADSELEGGAQRVCDAV